MRFDKVIGLIAITYTTDDIAQEVEVPVTRSVYANQWSVSASERYEAGRSGHKLAARYQLRSCDYADEVVASVDGVEYDIIGYDDRGEFTIIDLERRVGTVQSGETS